MEEMIELFTGMYILIKLFADIKDSEKWDFLWEMQQQRSKMIRIHYPPEI